MMTKEDPIELVKKENLKKKQIQKKKGIVDRHIYCTQWAVDRSI